MSRGHAIDDTNSVYGDDLSQVPVPVRRAAKFMRQLVHRRVVVLCPARVPHPPSIVNSKGGVQLSDQTDSYQIRSFPILLDRGLDGPYAYNEPPVVIGDEPNRARVDLLRDWLSSYRPGAEPGDGDGDGDSAEPMLAGGRAPGGLMVCGPPAPVPA
jgi:hypothetical protein